MQNHRRGQKVTRFIVSSVFTLLINLDLLFLSTLYILILCPQRQGGRHGIDFGSQIMPSSALCIFYLLFHPDITYLEKCRRELIIFYLDNMWLYFPFFYFIEIYFLIYYFKK